MLWAHIEAGVKPSWLLMASSVGGKYTTHTPSLHLTAHNCTAHKCTLQNYTAHKCTAYIFTAHNLPEPQYTAHNCSAHKYTENHCIELHSAQQFTAVHCTALHSNIHPCDVQFWMCSDECSLLFYSAVDREEWNQGQPQQALSATTQHSLLPLSSVSFFHLLIYLSLIIQFLYISLCVPL